MAQPPDAARLADILSQRISNHAAAVGSGKAPPKLLQWALGQLEECARTRSAPPSNVVEVAMAAIKDEIGAPAGVQQTAPSAVDSSPAGGAGDAASAVSNGGDGGEGGREGGGNVDEARKAAGKGSSSSRGDKKTTAGGRSGGGARSKGQVVFTPLYGCDEGATGVGPVSSILEVRVRNGPQLSVNWTRRHA